MASNTPFSIDPNATTNPWLMPLVALNNTVYPPIGGYVVPNAYAISGFLIVFLVISLGATLLRWRQQSVRFFTIQNGYFIPSTSNVYSFFVIIWLSGVQVFIWREVQVWRNQGDPYGIHIALALAWVPLSLSIWSLVYGLSLTTYLAIVREQRIGVTKAPTIKAPTPFSWKNVFVLTPTAANLLGCCLPLLFSTPMAGLAITSEIRCGEQYRDYLRARSIAEREEAAWDGQPQSIDNQSLLGWYDALDKMQKNRCSTYERMEYIVLLAWLSLLLAGSLFTFDMLYRRLRNQAELLAQAGRTVQGAQEHATTAGFSMNKTEPLASSPSGSSCSSTHTGIPVDFKPDANSDAKAVAQNLEKLAPPSPFIVTRGLGEPNSKSKEAPRMSGHATYEHDRHVSHDSESRLNWNSISRKSNHGPTQTNSEEAQKLFKRSQDMRSAMTALIFQGCLTTFCLVSYVCVAAIEVAKGKLIADLYVAIAWIYVIIGGASLILLLVVGQSPSQQTFFGLRVVFPQYSSANSPGGKKGSNSHARDGSHQHNGLGGVEQGEEEDEQSLVGFQGNLRSIFMPASNPHSQPNANHPESHGPIPPGSRPSTAPDIESGPHGTETIASGNFSSHRSRSSCGTVRAMPNSSQSGHSQEPQHGQVLQQQPQHSTQVTQAGSHTHHAPPITTIALARLTGKKDLSPRERERKSPSISTFDSGQEGSFEKSQNISSDRY